MPAKGLHGNCRKRQPTPGPGRLGISDHQPFRPPGEAPADTEDSAVEVNIAPSQFKGVEYFDPDPRYRIRCRLERARPGNDWLDIDTGGEDGVIHYRRSGMLRFRLDGVVCELTVFAMTGYGGGLFLPFKDATSGRESYGGGRYLFDTVKSTDGLSLEITPGSAEVMIDFNYACNPSCAYDDRWACPLAPRENWLSVPIRAGEKTYR